PRRVSDPSMRSSWASAAPWKSSRALPARTGAEPAVTGRSVKAVQPAVQKAARSRLPPPSRASPADSSSSTPSRDSKGRVCSRRAVATRSVTSVARPAAGAAMQGSPRAVAAAPQASTPGCPPQRAPAPRWWTPAAVCDGPMNTTTITISQPEDIVAYLPYRLGFRPRDSVVLLAMCGERNRLGLVTRADLADIGHPRVGPALVRDVSRLMAEE